MIILDIIRTFLNNILVFFQMQHKTFYAELINNPISKAVS